MRNIIIGCIACLILFSCQQQKPKSVLDELAWLEGSWQKITENVQYYENWHRENDSAYTGIGYVMSEDDTVFFENISIRKQGDGIYYTASVSNQNNSDAVSFRFISDSGGVYLFENPEHDFPQRIGYSNPSPDSLYAFIEGKYKGETRKEEFPMARKK